MDRIGYVEGDFSSEFQNESPKRTALSTSFIISLEEEDSSLPKPKKNIKSSNLFVKKHVRTLSLPCTDDDRPMKDYTTASHTRLSADGNCNDTGTQDENSRNCGAQKLENGSVIGSKCQEKASDSGSDGGTYTLEKDNPQVQLARKSIDQVFGISTNSNTPEDENKYCHKTQMIDKWMEQSATAIERANQKKPTLPIAANSSLKTKLSASRITALFVSKIPSPIVTRRELSLHSNHFSNPIKNNIPPSNSEKLEKPECYNETEAENCSKLVNSPMNGEINTECFLRETENIVAALQNMLHTDLKSASVSAVKPSDGKPTIENKYSNTKFNRTFSLRRDRAKTSSPVIANTAIPVRSKCTPSTNINEQQSNGQNKYALDKKSTTPKDLGRIKKSSPSIASPALTKGIKTDDSWRKKTNQGMKKIPSGVRSNSSLSPQEIEFQNWKRRKSYDPLKAAAEDRKKRLLGQSGAISSSSNMAYTLTQKQRLNESDNGGERMGQGIVRSASFHGLRNKNGLNRSLYSEENLINNRRQSDRLVSSCHSEDDNSISSDLLDDNDDWDMPKPPLTSPQYTPPESVSSQLSLLGNTVSYSSASPKSSSARVNFASLKNVFQLSQEIKPLILTLTNSLRSSNGGAFENSTVKMIQGERKECAHSSVNSNNGEIKMLAKDINKDSIIHNDGLSYKEIMGDHLLSMTLNNLKQTHEAVQELRSVFANIS